MSLFRLKRSHVIRGDVPRLLAVRTDAAEMSIFLLHCPVAVDSADTINQSYLFDPTACNAAKTRMRSPLGKVLGGLVSRSFQTVALAGSSSLRSAIPFPRGLL